MGLRPIRPVVMLGFDHRSKLDPHSLGPAMLRTLCSDVHVVDAPEFRMLGAKMGTRSTIVRQPDGLVLISPVAFDDATAAAIDALGEVRWIVAPNGFHHLFVDDACARWPNATLVASTVAAGKHPSWTPAHHLGAAFDATSVWGPGLDAHWIDGAPKLDETAFWHNASGTLVLTDFFFNFEAFDGWWTGLFLGLFGAKTGPVQTKILRSTIADRPRVAERVDALLALEPERIIVCHGAVVESGGAEALRTATAWMRA